MSCAEFVRWAESDSAHQCYVSWDFPGPGRHTQRRPRPSRRGHPVAGGVCDQRDGFGHAQLGSVMGARGVVAQSHYDIQHNIFAQLRGEKTFVVAPPSRRSRTASSRRRTCARASRSWRRCRRRRRRCARPTSDRATCCTAAALAAPRDRRRRALRLGQPLPGQPRERRRARARPRRAAAGAAQPRKDDLPFPSRVALLALWLRFLLHRACGGAPSPTAADAAAAAAATVLRPHPESRLLLHERIGCASWAPSLARRAPSCRLHSSTRRARTRRRTAALDEWLPAGRCGAPPRGRELRCRRRRGRRRRRRELLLQQHAELTGRAVRRAAAVRLPEMPRSWRRSVGNVDF